MSALKRLDETPLFLSFPPRGYAVTRFHFVFSISSPAPRREGERVDGEGDSKHLYYLYIIYINLLYINLLYIIIYNKSIRPLPRPNTKLRNPK